jgi:DNA mismatch endonuclease (patch repair protein)
MRMVRRRHTAAELAVRRVLRAEGLRFTTQTRYLPGTPDFLVAARLAIFVDGCFWHGCSTHFTVPRRNRHWWRRKIAANRRRDARKDRQLRHLGYSILHVWEHDSPERVRRRVKQALRSGGGR